MPTTSRATIRNLLQPTFDNFPNDFMRMFVMDLDGFVTMITGFDSRKLRGGLNWREVEQCRQILHEMDAICLEHGGEANARPVPSGLLRNDLDDTFNFDGRFDPQHQQLDMGNTGRDVYADNMMGSLDQLASDRAAGQPAPQSPQQPQPIQQPLPVGPAPITRPQPGRPIPPRR